MHRFGDGILPPSSGEDGKIAQTSGGGSLVLVITIGLSLQLENETSTMAGIGLFALSALWLVARGEIRAELKTLSQREQLLAIAGQDNVKKLSLGTGQLDTYDPKRLELQQKRKKRRDLTTTEDDSELYTTDDLTDQQLFSWFYS